MARNTLTLTIRLGNAAMSSPEDIADALRRTAATIEAGSECGNIRDTNGNLVGSFTVNLPNEEC